MTIYENGDFTPAYKAEQARIEALKAERGETRPFEIGKSYRTMDGRTVTCIEVNDKPHYETARFDDGKEVWCMMGGYVNRYGRWVREKRQRVTTGWRYNRNSIDRGRVTGTAFDHSDPRCVIPEPAHA